MALQLNYIGKLVVSGSAALVAAKWRMMPSGNPAISMITVFRHVSHTPYPRICDQSLACGSHLNHPSSPREYLRLDQTDITRFYFPEGMEGDGEGGEVGINSKQPCSTASGARIRP